MFISFVLYHIVSYIHTVILSSTCGTEIQNFGQSRMLVGRQHSLGCPITEVAVPTQLSRELRAAILLVSEVGASSQFPGAPRRCYILRVPS